MTVFQPALTAIFKCNGEIMDGIYHRIIISAVFFAVLLLTGCALIQPPQSEPVTEEEASSIPQYEAFDPLSIEGDDIIDISGSDLPTMIKSSTSTENVENKEGTAATVEISGFRVQIFATSEEHEARSIEEEALLTFTVPVYLTFDPPNYKIRIGNCRTREEATAIKKTANKKGYRDAWVVPSKVIVPNR